QRDDQLRDVARAMERGNRFVEEHERGLGFTSRCMEARRVAGEEPLEEMDAVLPHDRDSFVPRGEGTPRICLREGLTRDPERVRDPVGVAVRTGRGDRLLSERDRLVDATARLQAVDVGREAVAAIASIPTCDVTGELDVAVEVAAVHLAERLDERRVARFARVVSLSSLELGSPMRSE